MQFSNQSLLRKQFRVQGMTGVETIITILSDLGDAYSILMTSHSNMGTRDSEEILQKELFSSCLRTGYLKEVEVQMLTIA